MKSEQIQFFQPGPFHSRERQGLIPTNAKASETWAAWRRRSAATLVWPAQRTRVLVRLRKAAITPGRGRGQALGGVAGPYLGAVFVKGDVPHPMHPVLDVPMLPENPQQSIRPSNSRSHTGYRIAPPLPESVLSPSAAALSGIPVSGGATLLPPSRRCPRSGSTPGRPGPTVPAAPSGHGAASATHPPTPSARPLSPAIPEPATGTRTGRRPLQFPEEENVSTRSPCKAG